MSIKLISYLSNYKIYQNQRLSKIYVNPIMAVQPNQDPQLLFKIDIKVGQRIVTLNVKQGDTIQSLLLKHKMGIQANKLKFQQLKQKIKTNIQKQVQIKVYSNQFQLAEKMEVYLRKQNQQENNCQVHKEFQRTQNRLNQKVVTSQTPFKMLFEKTLTQVREQSRQSPSFQSDQIQSRKVIINDDQVNQNILKEVSLTKNQPKNSKLKASTSVSLKQNTKVYKQTESQKKSVAHKMDEDLIKAYEVIWKKSKDKTMREMAENTLKQLNVLPHEEKITEFLPTDSEKKQKDNLMYTGNDESIKSQTPIEKSQKQSFLKNGLIKNDPFSESRSFMRRNYRYSYLEQNTNLHYPYEKAERSNDKYSYNRLDQTYVNILNKDYDQKSYQKIHIQPPGNRRYNYLDD